MRSTFGQPPSDCGGRSPTRPTRASTTTAPEVQSDWKVGSRLVYLDHGEVSLDCKILEIDPAHRLVHSFKAVYDPETAGDRPSRVTWEIEKLGDVCRLTVVHDDFDGETATYRDVEHGWSQHPVRPQDPRRDGPAARDRREHVEAPA